MANNINHSSRAQKATKFSVFFIIILYITEFIIGERSGLAAFITYFPQHLYIIPIAISLLLAVFERNARLIIVNLLIFTVFLLVFMGFHLGFGRDIDSDRLTVMTWNVHRPTHTREEAISLIENQSPGVLFLQEINDGGKFVKQLKSRGWNLVWTADVAVASKMPLKTPTIHCLLPNSKRRAICTQVNTSYGPIDLVCVHFATNVQGTSRRHPIAYLRGAAKSRAIQVANLSKIAGNTRTIIAGDCNLPPRGVVYNRLTRRYRSTSSAERGFGYIYPSRFPLLRVDHILTSPDIRTGTCDVIKTKASDHLPVVAQLIIPLK